MEIVAQDGSGTAVLSNVSSMAQVTRGEPVFDWSNTDFRVRETLRTANVEPDGEMSIGTNEKPYSTGYFNQIYIGGNPVSVIEEEGTSGIWYYRKWSSGTAECYGTLSTAPYNCPGYNGFDVSLPFTFSNTSYTVVVQPTINGLLTSYHAIMDGSGNNSKTTTKFILSYGYTSSTAYQVHFDIHVFGRWK